MMIPSISCGYRIYPSWFGGGNMAQPMRELADNAAAQMGRRVLFIGITDRSVDWRDPYIDFRVVYSSTVAHDWMQRKP